MTKRHPAHAAAVRSWVLNRDQLGKGRKQSAYHAVRAGIAYRRQFGKRAWRYQLSRIDILGRDVPDAEECHTHGRGSTQTCKQCDGGHDHKWRNTLITYHHAFGYRCRVCGGRKCDDYGCKLRRHHGGPHVYWNGRIEGE